VTDTPNITHADALRTYLAQLDRAIGELTETRYAIWRQLMECRNVTPLGDRREQTVRCDACDEPTWAIDRLCGACWMRLDGPGLASA
jgi:hypothetical protein